MTRPPKLHTLGHSLGINIYHAKVSKLKRDKKLPKEFYRNYFVTSKNSTDYPIIEELINEGLMCQGQATINLGGSDVYHVTDLGIESFKKQFNHYMMDDK